jgi:protein-S-isoprenylcysteine O-methyltransferase Ste14
MKRTLRFITGYLIGGLLFIFLIPYGLFQLSRLDYLSYKMIIGSMAARRCNGCTALTGFIFIIWSNIFLLTIGKGGPADGFGVTISPRTSSLVTGGPYKYCRHPMVFGAFTYFLSVVIYLNSISGLIALILLIAAAIFYLKEFEEKRLMRDFGKDYAVYSKKVPMIIPRPVRNVPVSAGIL